MVSWNASRIGLLAALVARGVAEAAPPPGLLVSTVKAATLLAAGDATAAGMISAKVGPAISCMVRNRSTVPSERM